MARILSIPLRAPRTSAARLRLAAHHLMTARANLEAAQQQVAITQERVLGLGLQFWVVSTLLRRLDAAIFQTFKLRQLAEINREQQARETAGADEDEDGGGDGGDVWQD